jgi:putative FmdB family regulatory protein
MPLYDVECVECGTVCEVYAQVNDRAVACRDCGAPTERVWQGRAPAAIGDSLPGGARWIENLGDKPVFVESKSQLNREMRDRGLQQYVRHQGGPHSDKSRHTTRWF